MECLGSASPNFPYCVPGSRAGGCNPSYLSGGSRRAPSWKTYRTLFLTPDSGSMIQYLKHLEECQAQSGHRGMVSPASVQAGEKTNSAHQSCPWAEGVMCSASMQETQTPRRRRDLSTLFPVTHSSTRVGSKANEDTASVALAIFYFSSFVA